MEVIKSSYSIGNILFFPSLVDSVVKDKEKDMKKYHRFRIKPLLDNNFLVIARLRREDIEIVRQATIKGIKAAEAKGAELVELVETLYKEKIANENSSLKNFSDYIDYYEEYHGIGKNNKTYFNRLKVELGHLESTDEIIDGLNIFINSLGRLKTRFGKPYSNATKNRYQSWARAVLNFCMAEGKIPFQKLKEHKKFKETPRTRIIKEDELLRLLESIEKIAPYFLPVTHFSLQIPTRKSALMNMKKSWVNLKDNIIVIPVQYTKHGKHDDVKPIPPSMIDYFKSIPKESEYVFYKTVDEKYVPLTDYDFNKVWNKCKLDANVENLRFHDTRHHSATQLLLTGISERVVMQAGGWKTNMFSTYYNHDGIKASQEVFNVLAS